MEDKEVYTSKENSDIAMPITKNDNRERKNNAQVVYPIVSRKSNGYIIKKQVNNFII